MAGINRAEAKGKDRELFEHKVCDGDPFSKCVFISHKSSDMEAAEAIATYLSENDIDYYLDKEDYSLQKATQDGNAIAIVNHIQDALTVSTHILALISEETVKSWWVPYEIGFSKKGNKNIASLILTGSRITSFPDYLKIEKMIKSAGELSTYADEIKGRNFIFESTSVSSSEYLSKYIKNVKV